ncbi:MAG: hypothetical protein K2J91_01680 [Lachnospiraceae bacterium]|nr:hypothetical protein [Lachnospiraceae bacterium]
MQQEKFYSLSQDLRRKYKYLEKIVGGNLEIRKRCHVCGQYVEFDERAYKDLIFEVSDNPEYPDNIMFGGSPNFIIISQRALEVFNKESITGFQAYPITILHKGQKIERQYYILRVYGKAEYNYKKMGKKPAFYCENCGYTEYSGKRPLNYEFTYLKENSWDGSDLFSLSAKYCTEKVINIIKKNKLTGFDAEDIIHSLNPHEQSYWKHL